MHTYTHKKKTRLWKISIIVFIVLSVLISLKLWFYNDETCAPPDTSLWNTGDVFFSSGKSWKSTAVRLTGGCKKEDCTHTGFVIREKDEIYLVHMSTEYSEIVKEKINDYITINDISALYAMRVRESIDTLALKKRLYTLLQERKQFDCSFDIQNAENYYCTELVLRELLEVGIKECEKLMAVKYAYPADLKNSGILYNL